MVNHWINFRSWVRQSDSCVREVVLEAEGRVDEELDQDGAGIGSGWGKNDVVKWLGTRSYILRKTEWSWKFERRPSGSPVSGWEPPRLKGWKPHFLPEDCSWMLGGAGRSCALQTDGTPGKPCACAWPDEPLGIRFGRLANRRFFLSFLLPWLLSARKASLQCSDVSLSPWQRNNGVLNIWPHPVVMQKGRFGGLMNLVGVWNVQDQMPLRQVPRSWEGDALAPHWSNLDQITEGCLSLGKNLELERTFIKKNFSFQL